jgi:hypothetical protein
MDADFNIVIAPMITPTTPNPIAKIKKFRFSVNMDYPMLYALMIDNVPSKASSRRIVSVA